ncbi:ribonuclease HII [Fervidibacillus halotolerans]|uniref:Ribonuclease HII n=1 Tax=Fervidibacillus halotolerans TaxID=2980027 RepID=A0A9E8M154_9BACI|nr:ribonuclease HII [Fervidibacillus halotolerans]WAA13618.1 ribonuclease HII [Fervidibacillus halotolerans]
MNNRVHLTLAQIEEKLKSVTSLDDPLIALCEQDERKSVAKLIEKWKRKKERLLQEEKRLEEMLVFEKQVKFQGFRYIAGIDEVGRGPLAGPVVAAAVILPDDFRLQSINDSKQLSPKKREQLYEQILRQAISVGIGMVDHEEIDRINIYQATKKAMNMAIKQLSPLPDYLLIDGMNIDCPISQTSIVKGDARSLSIASASIVAKVRRDRMMIQYGKTYPEYGFERNMGYGTKEHLEAINRFGPSPIHRKTFAPIKQFFDSTANTNSLF